MNIYISEFGRLITGELIRETPKGYRVLVVFGGRTFERLYYRRCPNGNHRAFAEEEEARADAQKFIIEKEAGALKMLDKCAKLYRGLAEA